MNLKKIIKNKWFIYSNLSITRAIIKLLNRNTKLVLEQLPIIIGAVLKNIKLKMGFRTIYLWNEKPIKFSSYFESIILFIFLISLKLLTLINNRFEFKVSTRWSFEVSNTHTVGKKLWSQLIWIKILSSLKYLHITLSTVKVVWFYYSIFWMTSFELIYNDQWWRLSSIKKKKYL